MGRSLDLKDILSISDDMRDQEWEKTLFQGLAESELKILSSEPKTGPDGWPYLFVSSEEDGKEPAIKILKWLAEKGIGLVLNPTKRVPDYVFTFGMIWNFNETGQFLTDLSGNVGGGQVRFEEGDKVQAGPPSPEYLPTYVREVLREFFQQQEINEPKILVLGKDNKHFDLCFSLDSLGNPPEKEHRGIAEALSWFLPAHYSVMLAKEKGFPEFHNL